MKVAPFALVLSLVALGGHSTADAADNEKDDSETVLITYHAKSGKEADMAALKAARSTLSLEDEIQRGIGCCLTHCQFS
jgi:hypothetical protein